jgi:hypothetical protein
MSPALFTADISLFSSLLCGCFFAVILLLFCCSAAFGNSLFSFRINALRATSQRYFVWETAKPVLPMDGIGPMGA